MSETAQSLQETPKQTRVQVGAFADALNHNGVNHLSYIEWPCSVFRSPTPSSCKNEGPVKDIIIEPEYLDIHTRPEAEPTVFT